MKSTHKTLIDLACAEVGGQSMLAKILHVSPSAVNQWSKGIRPIPIVYCPAIETATKGLVNRQSLRPDDWMKIWPELVKKKPTLQQ